MCEYPTALLYLYTTNENPSISKLGFYHLYFFSSNVSFVEYFRGMEYSNDFSLFMFHSYEFPNTW